MPNKLTDAKINANKKWNEKNKERMRYLNYRSSARSLIKKHATIDDIKELRQLLDEREKNIEL